MLISHVGAVQTPLVIKVGISDYRPVEEVYQHYQQFFARLETLTAEGRQSGTLSDLPPIAFEVAVGNYDEVLDWFTNRTIDVAVLAATPMAEMISHAGLYDRQRIQDSYLGTVTLKYPASAVTLGTPSDPHYYESVAVVRNESPYEYLQNLKDGQEFSKAEYWFVRPYSFSGYILPNAFLRSIGIAKPKGTLQYQHKDSLEHLLTPQAPTLRNTVAFVMKGLPLPPCAAPWRILKASPALITASPLSTPIPMDAIIVNYGIDKQRYASIASSLRMLLKLTSGRVATAGHDEATENPKDCVCNSSTRESQTPCGPHAAPIVDVATDLQPSDWLKGFERIIEATRAVPAPDLRERRVRVTLAEILQDLHHYAEQSGKRPRLAVVFSGGGAKCAYQVGAIHAIEASLASPTPEELKMRQKDGFVPTIDLAVGTSGGAINALFTAMYLTAGDGQSRMSKFWEDLDQADIVTPTSRLRGELGLAIALLQVGFFTIFAAGNYALYRKTAWICAMLLVVFQAVAILYFRLPTIIFSLLLLELAGGVAATFGLQLISILSRRQSRLRGHVRQTGILIMSLAILETALIGIGYSIAYLVTHVAASHFQWLHTNLVVTNHIPHHLWAVIRIEAAWSLPFVFVLGVLIFFLEGFFSTGQVALLSSAICGGILGVLLIGTVLWREQSLSRSKGLEISAASNFPALFPRDLVATIDPRTQRYEALQDLSKQIFDRKLLKRDLIITASRIVPVKSAEIPEDLYFYYRSNCSGDNDVPLDRRFISLSNNSDQLLHITISSGTIYPLFEASTLPVPTLERGPCGDKPRETQRRSSPPDFKIVDGGFIHNQPVEAAVDWGATHVILLAASPDSAPTVPMDFFQNSMLAFDFLFNEAQKTDSLSMGKAQIYELRPTSACELKEAYDSRCSKEELRPDPQLDVFDFSHGLIEKAISQGAKDARSSQIPLYTRIPGQPVFRPAVEHRALVKS
jgi:predicted acylesterase/phospholipase RssA